MKGYVRFKSQSQQKWFRNETRCLECLVTSATPQGWGRGGAECNRELESQGSKQQLFLLSLKPENFPQTPA